MSDLIAVTTACASEEEAARIADALLDACLAAGVQIGRVESRFVWRGERSTQAEWRLKAWARRSAVEAVRAAIRGEHSYEVFEFTVSPLEPADDPFADWVRENTAG